MGLLRASGLGIFDAIDGNEFAGVLIDPKLHLGNVATGSFADIPIFALFSDIDILVVAQGYFLEALLPFGLGRAALE
jgi:hypothetical protein